MKKNKIVSFILIITICLIVLDQISKIIIQCNYKEPIEKGIIGIKLIENTGIAFGLNNGNTKNIILTSLVLLIIINFIKNQKDRIDMKNAIAISFILSGGSSNLIDRIARGGIVDFIELKHFAIFNIADCYIFIGWLLLIIFVIGFEFREKEVKKKVEVENCEKQ